MELAGERRPRPSTSASSPSADQGLCNAQTPQPPAPIQASPGPTAPRQLPPPPYNQLRRKGAGGDRTEPPTAAAPRPRALLPRGHRGVRGHPGPSDPMCVLFKGPFTFLLYTTIKLAFTLEPVPGVCRVCVCGGHRVLLWAQAGGIALCQGHPCPWRHPGRRGRATGAHDSPCLPRAASGSAGCFGNTIPAPCGNPAFPFNK